MCGECLNLIAVRAFIYHQSRLIIIERWSHSQLGSISSSSVQRMAQTHRFQTHLAHTFSSDRSVSPLEAHVRAVREDLGIHQIIIVVQTEEALTRHKIAR